MVAVGLWLACALSLATRAGHAQGPPAPPGGDPNRVVRSVANEHYEVVLKYRAEAGSDRTRATIYVSDYATNAPIDGARIDLRTTAPVQTNATATRSRPGVYEVDLVHPKPGDYTLILTVQGPAPAEFALQELPLGKTVAAGTAPAAPRRRGAFPVVPAVLIAIALAVAWFLIARRMRSRASVKVEAATLIIAAGLLAAYGSSRGHAGHSQAPKAGESGPRYVPKESQFLLDVRTRVARIEPLREQLTATGHVVPESGALATVLTPQTGRFEKEGRLPAVGDRVREGQLLGYVLVIDRLPIRAPISGLVSELNVTSGQWVEGGRPLMTVLDERKVRVEVPLFGEHLTKALKARSASVQLSALPDRLFPAVVRGLAPTASSPEPALEGNQQPTASPIAPLILTVSNTGGFLRPGMLVEVSIETGIPQNVLAVPTSAVVYQETGPGVFVHTAPEVFEYRPVSITGRYPGRVGITDEVKPGERLTTEGSYTLVSAPPASTAPAGR